MERIKILEGKISQVVDYINKLLGENERLKHQVKELKTERRKFEEKAKQSLRLEDNLKKCEGEREAIKGKIEVIISQIDQLGI